MKLSQWAGLLLVHALTCSPRGSDRMDTPSALPATNPSTSKQGCSLPDTMNAFVKVPHTTIPKGPSESRVAAGSRVPVDTPTTSKEAPGKYLTVRGTRLYYETHGHGDPLILLHGGFFNMDYWKAYQLPEFQKSHEVVLLDTRGHGRSELGNEAFRYSTLSRDVLALMDHLGFQKAHFVGWSDGGVVALQLALQEPQRVGRIVLNGASFAFQGSFAPWVEYVVSTEWLFRLSMLKYYDAFAATQPDPTRWRTFVGRMHALWSSPCYLDEYLGEYLGDYLGERQREREHEGARHGNERSPADCIPLLGRISQEVLILNGDQEVITPSHTLALFGALPRARLTLLEGATHFAARERPDAFNDAVLSFLRP